MENEENTLGEICRGALAMAFNGRISHGASPDPRVLDWLRDHIEHEVLRLRAGILATLETTEIGHRPLYTIALPSACEDFKIEDAPGFEKILDFCAQENISVQVMPTLARAGTRATWGANGRIERQIYHTLGFCLTFDPLRKFRGLERQENETLANLIHEKPAP